MTTHEVVSKGEWVEARKRFLAKKKTRAARFFRTHSTFGRGIEMMNTAYQYLDLVPRGRDEAGCLTR